MSIDMPWIDFNAHCKYQHGKGGDGNDEYYVIRDLIGKISNLRPGVWRIFWGARFFTPGMGTVFYYLSEGGGFRNTFV